MPGFGRPFCATSQLSSRPSRGTAIGGGDRLQAENANLFRTGWLSTFPTSSRRNHLSFSSSHPTTTSTSSNHDQHDVFYLLDVSLAREQLGTSSAASARKCQPCFSASAGPRTPTTFDHRALQSQWTRQIGFHPFALVRGVKFLVVS